MLQNWFHVKSEWKKNPEISTLCTKRSSVKLFAVNPISSNCIWRKVIPNCLSLNESHFINTVWKFEKFSHVKQFLPLWSNKLPQIIWVRSELKMAGFSDSLKNWFHVKYLNFYIVVGCTLFFQQTLAAKGLFWAQNRLEIDPNYLGHLSSFYLSYLIDAMHPNSINYLFRRKYLSFTVSVVLHALLSIQFVSIALYFLGNWWKSTVARLFTTLYLVNLFMKALKFLTTNI